MIEDKNFLNNDQIKFIDNIILGSGFPYYLYDNSVDNDKNKFLCHIILIRPEEKNGSEPFYNSNFYEPVLDIFKSFVLKNNIEVKEVLRCAINLTFNTMEEKCSTHYDRDWETKIRIIKRF